jgi:2-polyprenyl-3-methyl-5-hydroxy-6-metoxy-1,4-benzoquinol methylase
MGEINYKNCPVCESDKNKIHSVVRDYSVSKKEFSLVQCTSCSFIWTQNMPDEHSIGPFYKNTNYVSHSDTQKGLFFKTYHLVRNWMLKRKRNLIIQKSGLKKGKLLDIGSATGYFLNTMKQAGWEVEGIEQDTDAQQLAKEKFGIQSFFPNEIYNLPPQSYDVITLWHVLEHIHQLNDNLQQIHKLLKPNGVLIVAVPNHQSFDAVFYEKHWAGWDIPIHLWHFSVKSMHKLMDKHQFSIIQTKTLPFDHFYVSLLSEKYQKGNAFRALCIGLISMFWGFFNIKKSSSIIYIIKKK